MISEAGSRPVNQDFAAFDTVRDGAVCWVLADGLGGHGGGEQASRIAVERAIGSYRAGQPLPGCVSAANAAMVEAQDADASLAHMRTTIVALAIAEGRASWAHVGDSRLYRVSGGRVRQCTRDHSFLQALVDSGRMSADAVRFHEDRGRLLKSLGAAKCEPDLGGPVEVCAGDAWLLTSDGWWEPVTEREMEVEFAKSTTAREWLEGMRRRILERRSPDQDNFSAIAVFAS